MTTVPSTLQKNRLYGDESPMYDRMSQGYSGLHLPTEKAIFDIEEIDDGDDPSTNPGYKSGGIPPLHSRTKVLTSVLGLDQLESFLC